jgi:hypothetical protein
MDNVTESSDYSSRISVFRQLTTDKLTNAINEDIFRGLLDEFYDQFVETCEYVKANAEKIKYISCYIENAEIKFDFEYVS